MEVGGHLVLIKASGFYLAVHYNYQPQLVALTS